MLKNVLPVEDRLAALAKEALAIWDQTKPLPAACFNWAARASARKVLECGGSNNHEPKSLSVDRQADPLHVVLTPIFGAQKSALQVALFLADHSKATLTFDPQQRDAVPHVTWKPLGTGVKEVSISTDVLWADQKMWPRNWHRLLDRSGRIEVFISTTDGVQGLVVVRMQETELVRHYLLQKALYAFAHIGDAVREYPAALLTSHNGANLEVHLVPRGHASAVGASPCIRGVVLPDEYVTLPLDDTAQALCAHFTNAVEIKTS